MSPHASTPSAPRCKLQRIRRGFRKRRRAEYGSFHSRVYPSCPVVRPDATRGIRAVSPDPSKLMTCLGPQPPEPLLVRSERKLASGQRRPVQRSSPAATAVGRSAPGRRPAECRPVRTHTCRDPAQPANPLKDGPPAIRRFPGSNTTRQIVRVNTHRLGDDTHTAAPQDASQCSGDQTSAPARKPDAVTQHVFHPPPDFFRLVRW